jgi:transcriptional regulator GlxA family with amidase domain
MHFFFRLDKNLLRILFRPGGMGRCIKNGATFRSYLLMNPWPDDIAQVGLSMRKCQMTVFRGDPPATIADARIAFAVRALEGNCSLEIEDIANQVNLSASRFRHLFKQEMGISPNCFLRQLRLERAKHLVMGSFLTIKEIAAQVGINDISHFVKDYKIRFKEAPSGTRKSRSRAA